MRSGSNGKERSQDVDACTKKALALRWSRCPPQRLQLVEVEVAVVVVVIVVVVCTAGTVPLADPVPPYPILSCAVPSQQDGSTVAFAASSRIEAFLLAVWAVGWFLVPPPTAQIEFGGGFPGPTHPPQSWTLGWICAELWSCGAAPALSPQHHPDGPCPRLEAPVGRITPEHGCPCSVSQLSARRRHRRHTTHVLSSLGFAMRP